jgi:hypothetical protein
MPFLTLNYVAKQAILRMPPSLFLVQVRKFTGDESGIATKRAR